jgi:N6-adenosine-specific RNA methylase IME4
MDAEGAAGMIFSDLPRHAFDLIFIDPPWEFKARQPTGLKKSAQKHYRCMSDTEILALPVAYLARRPCWLFLPTSAPKLPLAIKCLEVWGFEYRSRIAWHKVTKNGKSRPGPGFVVRSHHEDVLIGAIGNPPYQRAFRSLFECPDEALDTFDGVAREHSRKPEELYWLIEEFAPGANRVDIFGRKTRRGWTVWGDQATKFDRVS